MARSLTRDGIGPVESPPGLGELEVALRPVALVHHVGRSLLHQPGQLGLVEEVLPALADAGGDVAEELFHQRPDAVLRLAPFEARSAAAGRRS